MAATTTTTTISSKIMVEEVTSIKINTSSNGTIMISTTIKVKTNTTNNSNQLSKRPKNSAFVTSMVVVAINQRVKRLPHNNNNPPTKRKSLTSRLTWGEADRKPSSSPSNISSITSKTKKVGATKTTWKVATQKRTFFLIKRSKTNSIMTSNNTLTRINSTTIRTTISSSSNMILINSINNTTTTINSSTTNKTSSSSITIKAIAAINNNNSTMTKVTKDITTNSKTQVQHPKLQARNSITQTSWWVVLAVVAELWSHLILHLPTEWKTGITRTSRINNKHKHINSSRTNIKTQGSIKLNNAPWPNIINSNGTNNNNISNNNNQLNSSHSNNTISKSRRDTGKAVLVVIGMLTSVKEPPSSKSRPTTLALTIDSKRALKSKRMMEVPLARMSSWLRWPGMSPSLP